MKMQVRIGSAGWSIPKESAGQFTSEGSHLQRYARVLNCAEINSSFYRPHQQATWERWASSVPDGFQFSVKAPRAITHEAKLNYGVHLLLPFLQQANFLGKKLGPLLFQLPPSLHFDRPVAESFLQLLRQNCSGDLVFEPRHPSWFDPAASILLKEFQIGRVAADPASVAAASEPGGFEEVAYFRLHGSPRRYYSEYSDDFLANLSARMLKLAAKRVWCIFDNTASGAAVRNALALNARVGSATVSPSPSPNSSVEGGQMRRPRG